MEVKLGYKKTEVGVIPEDWEVRFLRDTCWFQEGPGLRNWQFTTSGMKVINVTNLENGVLNLDRTDRHISLDLFRRMYQHFAVDDGDIVMASSGNSYSKTAVVRKHDLPLVMNTSVIRFKPAKSTEYAFLWSLLTSWIFKSQIDLMITGGAQPNFGPYHLKRIIVPFPPLPEQRAIATVLSDADALINLLEKLIAKKRDLKIAAMQQLLTGQTRLPGFRGEWGETTLGDLGTTFGGLTGKAKADFGEGAGQYITFMNVMTNVVIDCGAFERVKVLPTESQNRVMKGDLLFNGSSETPEEVAMCAVLTVEVPDLFLNSFCFGFRLRDKAEADGLFLAYYFRSREGRELMKSLAQGSTRYNLSKAAFLKLPLYLPTVSEQTAIAAVLADMDAELAVLEQRLAKTRDLKQGMMQELLTGRTRLV